MQAVLILSLIFAPLAFASVEPWALGLLQAAYFALAARLYIKGLHVNPNPLYKNLIPAVLAIAIIGLLQSLNQNPVTAPSATLFTAWRPATLAAAHLWLFYAAVLFTVPQLIDTPERFRRLMWTIFIMGTIVALLGMLQKTGDNTLVYGLRKVAGQPFGPFVNRDHGAHFLAISAMCGLGLFFSGLRPLFAQQSHTRLFDLLAVQFIKLVMLSALIYGIVHAGSRGGGHSFAAAAAITGFAAAAALRSRRQKTVAITLMTLAVVGYGILLANNDRMAGRISGGWDNSVKYRFSMYESSRRMLADFPAFGVGLKAVQYAFPHYKSDPLKETQLVLHVHSDWIELFLQSGLAGGLIYLAGLLAALIHFFRSWRSNSSFTLKCLQGGAIGAVIAACAHNFTEFASQMPANALLFFVVIGALAGPGTHRRGRDEDQDDPEPAPPPRARANAAALIAVLLIAAAIPRFIAWRADFLAKDKDIALKTKLAHRRASLRWYPDPQAAFRLGADIYNNALKDKDNATRCPSMAEAQKAIALYLQTAPVNQDLNRLNKNLRLQLAHCYNPRPEPKKPAAKAKTPKNPPPPTRSASRP
ncbi:MAG: O-antigen ligase family protein [Elusimicrobiales bacterium]|nr:O-antigen ligase family protein [Elusimicrobiales bacterium]